MRESFAHILPPPHLTFNKKSTHIIHRIESPISHRISLQIVFRNRNPIHLSRADGIGYGLLTEADRTRVEGLSRRERFETGQTETRDPDVTGRTVRNRNHAQRPDSRFGAARRCPLKSVGKTGPM